MKNLKYYIFCLFYILIANVFYIFLMRQKVPTENLWKLYIIISLIISFAAMFSFYLNKKYTDKVLKQFIIMIGLFGLINLLVTPLFGNPDEVAHYLRAYEVSTGHFFSEIRDNIGGRDLPESIISVLSTINADELHYSNILNLSSIKIDVTKKVFCNFTTAALYSPVAYMPQGLGMFLTRIFSKSVVFIGYGGRIVNFICSFLCYAFALKALPQLKRYLILIILFPMNLQLMSSLSPDALTNAVSILLIALCIKYSYFDKEKLLLKEKIIITLLCIILSLSKIVYLPICLITLIIPKIKFNSKKEMVLYTSANAFLCVFFNLAWSMFSKRFLIGILENVNPKAQLISVLKNPLKFLFICLNTIFENFQWWINTMVGSSLNWLNNNMPSLFISVFILLIFYILIVDNNIKGIFNKKDNILVKLIIVFCVGLIHASLYIQWTEVGAIIIRGIQGRYFIPIMPLIPVLLGNKLNKDEVKLNSLITNFLICFYLVVFLQCLNFNLL